MRNKGDGGDGREEGEMIEMHETTFRKRVRLGCYVAVVLCEVNRVCSSQKTSPF